MAYVTTTQLNNLTKALEGKTLYTQDNLELNVKNLSKISNCEKFSFTDFMNILNLKDSTVTLSCDLAELKYKLGTTIHNGTSLTANVEKGTYSITKIEFFVDNVSVSVITTDVENGGSFTYGYGLDITTNKKFKVVVTDEQGITVEDEIEVNFYNPYYYGSISKEIADITSADILSMTQLIDKKQDQKVKYTMSDARAIFAFDKSYGDLTSILDPSSFQNLQSFTKVEMTIDGVLCNVYILTTKCYCSDFEYNFKF